MPNRKPIHKGNCTEIGYIKKTYGIQGELMLFFENGMDEAAESVEFIFVEVEGLLVPFFVEDAAWRVDGTAAFKFRYIDTKEKAQEYIGCKVFVDRDDFRLDPGELNIQQLKGFKVIDEKLGEIGAITAINDFGGNIVFTVNYSNGEIMVPFNEDLLVSFDEKSAVLVMDYPDGLLDINKS